MQVHRNIDQLPAFRKAVVTIGTFDGVHQGHRELLSKLKEEASRIGGETVIITFHPHPRKIVYSAILGIRLINTMDEKIGLLAELGIDHLVIVPFTEAFANQSAEDYISSFLIDHFHPHTIIIGYDHRFGRDRLGDFRLLEKQASTYGYVLKEIPKHLLENISISSTNIREAILHSDFETANKLLGYQFFFTGVVVHGNKLGRKLGYPTANLKATHDEKILPGNGIYAVYAKTADGLPRKGMMSIGFRPTVDGKQRVVEVNLFDFNEEIYDQELQVTVKKYLREEIKFNGLDELVAQMGKDRISSLSVL